jgi:hypothetical protein
VSPGSKHILASPVLLSPSTHVSTSASLFRRALTCCRFWSKAVIPFSCLQHALVACLSPTHLCYIALQIMIGESEHDEFRCTSTKLYPSLYCQLGTFVQRRTSQSGNFGLHSAISLHNAEIFVTKCTGR